MKILEERLLLESTSPDDKTKASSPHTASLHTSLSNSFADEFNLDRVLSHEKIPQDLVESNSLSKSAGREDDHSAVALLKDEEVSVKRMAEEKRSVSTGDRTNSDHSTSEVVVVDGFNDQCLNECNDTLAGGNARSVVLHDDVKAKVVVALNVSGVESLSALEDDLDLLLAL